MALLDDIHEKKQALDNLRPLPAKAVHALADWFELELTAACLLVEGGDLTREEIQTVLRRGVVLRNRPPRVQQLVLNHRRSLELLARLSFQPNGVVTERTITAFHAMLHQGFGRTAGRYREGPLKEGGGGASPDPAKLRVSMSALSGWLRRTEPGPETAFEAHHRLMTVRPFDEGNASVALLLCNLILNRAGHPPVVVRADDVEAYRAATERAWSVGDKQPYRELMLRLLDQSLDVCLVGAAEAAAEPDAKPDAGSGAPG
ncbi:Fic family protein [Azospirillum sp. SYSU D00513]|uniref:Fic family protein n=1 Tax=Azospirillum sp. SYSU D00513 TaxID=2812561 RepID=UPI001A965834|nr:Fic family protein [Azospirillum sp. SYSU D00513]